MPIFNDIKTIFNRAMAASQQKIGHVDLPGAHESQMFPDLYGNFTSAQLKAGSAFGIPFFQPGVIPPPGTIGTQGDEANVVKALRGNLADPQLGPVPRMPFGGPPMPDPDIGIIVDWINHGCPD
jgi:hypothetical protein